MKPVSRYSAIALATVLITVVSLSAAPPFSLSRPTENKLQWQTNLQAAHRLAVSQNKPMLLVFGADWCHYCKKLERETLNSEGVAKFVNDGFVPIHIDVDKEKRVAEILQVSSLPCTIVLSPQADLLGRIDGYFESQPFAQRLAVAQQRYRQVQQTSASR